MLERCNKYHQYHEPGGISEVMAVHEACCAHRVTMRQEFAWTTRFVLPNVNLPTVSLSCSALQIVKPKAVPASPSVAKTSGARPGNAQCSARLSNSLSVEHDQHLSLD